jgi:hypothetical protein
LLGGLAAGARAGEREEILRLLADMAADLANDNASGFLRAFDEGMNGYEELGRDVRALLAAWEASASVELRGAEAAGAGWSAEADWYLQLKSKRDARVVEQKREVLRLGLQRQGKRWRITALEPREFFRRAG